MTGCVSNFQTPCAEGPVYHEYEILGPVTTTGKNVMVFGCMGTGNHKAQYADLLRIAKEQYPGCEDVVSVKVDKNFSHYFFVTITKYTLNGMAIKYK